MWHLLIPFGPIWLKIKIVDTGMKSLYHEFKELWNMFHIFDQGDDNVGIH